MNKAQYEILESGHLYIVGKKRNAMTFTELTRKKELIIYVSFFGTKKRLDRLVAEKFHPVAEPQKYDIYHIDGDYKNCSASNLQWRKRNRMSVEKQNQKRGVHALRNRWVATITDGGYSVYLGTFDEKEDAHNAFKKAYIKIHGVSPW